MIDTSNSVLRTKRSGDKGTRYRVEGNTPLPGNSTTFLKSVENKREHNEFLAKRYVETVLVGAGKIFIATCNENVLAIPNGGINVDSLQPCNHEEADTRMFLNAVHASSHRSTRVTIKSNDRGL